MKNNLVKNMLELTFAFIFFMQTVNAAEVVTVNFGPIEEIILPVLIMLGLLLLIVGLADALGKKR